MRALSNLMTAAADFVHAELADFRAGLVKAAVGIAVALAGAVLAVAGVAAILVSVYMYWTRVVEPATAALFTGIIAIVVGGVVAAIGARSAK